MRLLLAIVFLAFSWTAAQAELVISPLRQVLDEQHRSVSYRISNPSRRIIDGRVAWIDLLAAETGYLPASPEDRERMSAAPYLTVWPAFFRLEPGASVAVTVAIRDGAKPADSERRSHLLIQSAAARTPLRKAGGSLELDIGLGVSTPVILRHGEGKARARIGETRLVRSPDGLLELETVIEPEGDFSAYGRIEAFLSTDERTKEKLLSSIDNVAAYIDAPKRRFSVPLKTGRLSAGVMKLRYVGTAEFEGVVFAERKFELAPPPSSESR